MVSRLLACWGILVLLCAWHPPNGPFTQEVIGVEKIVKDMSLEGVEVDIVWAQCGHVNGFYFQGIGILGNQVVFPRTIVLCNELTQIDPAVARFIVAHEMGHALIHQRGLLIPVGEEAAADEIAYLYLGLVGRTEDLLKVAEHWFKQGREDNPFAAHPSDIRRGLMAYCMAAGSLGLIVDKCTGREWPRALYVWTKLLNEHLQELVLPQQKLNRP